MFNRIVPLLLILVLFACGGESSESQTTSGNGTDDDSGIIELEITGTIGVELGDSNYVLGAVQSIDHDADGNVLVLDRSSCCVRVYDSDGVFLRRISNQGSGPGEILNPMDMIVLQDGRIVVETPWSGGLHGFGIEGEWLGLLTPFYNNPPMRFDDADDSAYVATRLEVLPDGNGDLTVTTFIGRYEMGELPVATYYENEFPFDPGDLTDMLNNSIMGHVFCADADGNVFVASRSSEEYRVDMYRADGESFGVVEMDIEPVAKTPDEIEEEKVYVESYLESLGASGVVIEWIPDPYRPMISGIETDGEGRIWVRRGTEVMPFFDVFDHSGSLLFSATVPEAGADAQFWEFNIDEYGISAFSTNPELFQQVYLFSTENLP